MRQAIAFRIGGWALLVGLAGACTPADPETAPTPAPPPDDSVALRQELDAYARSIDAVSKHNVVPRKPAFKSADDPVSYILEFTTEHAALQTKDDGDSNRDSYVTNVGITAIWEARFCTDELKAIMRRHDVFLVSGKLFDKPGELQTFTACMQ